MATINYHVKGKKNPSPIYIRLAEGKSLDLWEKTGLYVNPSFWEAKKQQIRKVLEVKNRDDINSNLKRLEVYIIDQFNSAYMTGGIIDKIWLKSSVKNFFNRPKEEENLINLNRNIYLTDYADYWLEEKSKSYKVKADKFMDETSKGHYKQVVDNIKKFQGKDKILLKDITSKLLDDFSIHLSREEGFSASTVKRKISRFKFFCQRAELDNLNINKNYKDQVYVAREKTSYKLPYLNEEEILKIYKTDLSYDPTLDRVRDYFIIGLCTGLRVSDFLTRLKIEDFGERFIQLTTKKTNHSIAIPIHPLVRKTLDKNGGKLPQAISEQKFNDKIKIIGQIAEIDQEIVGGITMVEKEGEPARKKVGTYKKYLLISSHICRRSFCTNNYGKISNKSLMDIQGWKKESQMFDYMKQTNLESAKELEKAWENIYNYNE